jgi:hypothetical protein
MTPEDIADAFPLILEAKAVLMAFDHGVVWFSHVQTQDVMGVRGWGDEAGAVDVVYLPRDPSRDRYVRRLRRHRFKPWSLDWGDPELAEFGDGMYVISRALAWPVPDDARTMA